MLLDGNHEESSKALGIDEPDCVYLYVRASVFGANSL